MVYNITVNKVALHLRNQVLQFVLYGTGLRATAALSKKSNQN